MQTIGKILKASFEKMQKNITQTERGNDGWMDRGQFIAPTFKVGVSNNELYLEIFYTERQTNRQIDQGNHYRTYWVNDGFSVFWCGKNRKEIGIFLY